MHSEQKFWICMWGMVVTFLITVMVCLTLSGFDRRDKWDKAVSNGADPMVANCALYSADTSGDIAICTILAQNRK
jgi:hypothetical protein